MTDRHSAGRPLDLPGPANEVRRRCAKVQDQMAVVTDELTTSLTPLQPVISSPLPAKRTASSIGRASDS